MTDHAAQLRFCDHCGQHVTERIIEGRTRKVCRACDRIIYCNPVPANCIVVVDDRQRVALVKRSVPPKAGYWSLPGGFMEVGETPEGAALRELHEETGLVGRIELLLGVTATPSDQYETILMLGYLVRAFTGQLAAGDDAVEAAFFGLRQLPELAFSSHRYFLRLYNAAYGNANKIKNACG